MCPILAVKWIIYYESDKYSDKLHILIDNIVFRVYNCIKISLLSSY